MSAIIPGFEYDIFISYRQNDNRAAWVTDFVKDLQEELASTIKDPVSVYFDINPHNGLHEHHDVSDSLKEKLKCLIFIPILSRTYCDTKSFAFEQEFKPFVTMASADSLGLKVRLTTGNVTSRVLPVRIHELEKEDEEQFEAVTGSALRSIDFIFKSAGVNRPLYPVEDHPNDNLNYTFYRDQINKVANSIGDIIGTLKRTRSLSPSDSPARPIKTFEPELPVKINSRAGIKYKLFLREISRRHIIPVAITYILFSVFIYQFFLIGNRLFSLHEQLSYGLIIILIILFPVALILAWLFEQSPEGMIRTATPKSKSNPYSAVQKKPFTGNLVLILLVTILVLQNIYITKLKSIERNDLAFTDDKSIAVLPFESRSENITEYFTEGLTEDINAQLARINELRIIAAAALRNYNPKDISYSEMAEELGVSYILIGSIQENGDQLRIAPQLIEARTNKYIWADIYNVDRKDLFHVQAEIAQRIAGVLKIKLTEGEMKLINKKPTESLTAYDYYLKGRSYYYHYKAEDNVLAIDLFKKVIVLDPDFSLAWAGLGDAYNQRFGRFAEGSTWIDSAIYASRIAIQLDSNSSEGFKSLASAYYYLTRYDTSRKLMEKAVQLNPNNIAAIGNLGTSYFLDGELREALRLQKRSAGLNPKNFLPYQIIGWIYRLMGDYTNAESWLKKSLTLSTEYDTYELLAYVYVCQDRKKEALDLIPEVLKLDEEDPLVLETAGLIASFAGNTSEARKYFQRNMETNDAVNRDAQFIGNIHLGQIYLLQDNNLVDSEILLSNAMEMNLAEIKNGSLDRSFPFNIAGVYAIRGNPIEAIRWLDKAIDINWVDYSMLTHGPWFTSMRKHPELLKRIDLLKIKMKKLREQSSSL